ncbi:hypothetical protein RJC88_12445 [Acinetobacter baumannii]|uniref:hypothetical protein n=1 Tax=Acinetobacter calcoaceticus/baumannii complex TaxID=909768 RepID=UPI001125C3E2|nr:MULTISPECIES: hypothetical protein [Acinetobacter calcoaceticus/baumannii complex]MCV7485095.1 hypothetical protein [Acinetobacter baumannii]MCZ2967211.1 hypothetical protein [Acinetobacter baumannii]MDR9705291.1 hypothetical protein [Acinetobacter baumannii]MDV7705027.1 hypothetical protein [Acinetobacter pittii]MDV7760363.1 hypothetical protein [Acinetobacter pittii]
MRKSPTVEQAIKLYNNAHQSLTIKTEKDFPDIVSKSPYSNKSEEERRRELLKSVEEAKAALNTFTYQQKGFWIRIREMFVHSH